MDPASSPSRVQASADCLCGGSAGSPRAGRDAPTDKHDPPAGGASAARGADRYCPPHRRPRTGACPPHLGHRLTPAPAPNADPLPALRVGSLEACADGPDWRQARVDGRSRLGRRGVVFVSVAGQAMALKCGADVVREHAATQLAAAAGLTVPHGLGLVRAPCAALRLLAGALRGEPVLVMGRVMGRSCEELSPRDQHDLRVGSPRGARLFFGIGEVCAFDLLVGNNDRLPLPGLFVTNRGNLMVVEDGVVAIDNTVSRSPLLGTAEYRARYGGHLGRALAACREGDDGASGATASAALAKAVDFFPADMGITWAVMRGPFLAGLRAGVRRMAALADREIARLGACASGTAHDNAHLVAFVLENWATMRAEMDAWRRS